MHDCIQGMASDLRELHAEGDSCVSAVTTTSQPWCKDSATTLQLGDEFFTEAKVGSIIRTVNDDLPRPVFCTHRAFWRTHFCGYIAMDFAGKSLEEVMPSLLLPQLQSIVYQVLIALQWAQHRVQFKHHDLHTGNVFVKFSKVPFDWVTCSEDIVTLPCNSVQAVIADFGFSSASFKNVRYGRMDFSLLDLDGKAWGKWNNDLQDNAGYDAAVFLRSALDECSGQKRVWIKSLLDMLHSKNPGMKMSKYGRPLTNVLNTI